MQKLENGAQKQRDLVQIFEREREKLQKKDAAERRVERREVGARRGRIEERN